MLFQWENLTRGCRNWMRICRVTLGVSARQSYPLATFDEDIGTDNVASALPSTFFLNCNHFVTACYPKKKKMKKMNDQ